MFWGKEVRFTYILRMQNQNLKQLGAQTTNNVWFDNRNKAHILVQLQRRGSALFSLHQSYSVRSWSLNQSNALRAGLRAPLLLVYKFNPLSQSCYNKPSSRKEKASPCEINRKGNVRTIIWSVLLYVRR